MKFIRRLLSRLGLRRSPVALAPVEELAQSLRLKTFVDQHIDFTGKRVEQCVFDGCVLELRRDSGAQVLHNTFRCCELVGDGWPPGMVEAARRVQ